MTSIAVKPHPNLDTAAWPVLVHPVSGGLLDAAGKVPADGRPWLNDGFTARMLTDGAILRADAAVFAALEDLKPAPAASSAQAAAVAAKPATPPLKASSPDPAN